MIHFKITADITEKDIHKFLSQADFDYEVVQVRGGAGESSLILAIVGLAIESIQPLLELLKFLPSVATAKAPTLIEFTSSKGTSIKLENPSKDQIDKIMEQFDLETKKSE